MRIQFSKDMYLLSALWHSWADCGSLCFPPLTELPPLGFISILCHDFIPLSHLLHFHWHWSTRQVQASGGGGCRHKKQTYITDSLFKLFFFIHMSSCHWICVYNWQQCTSIYITIYLKGYLSCFSWAEVNLWRISIYGHLLQAQHTSSLLHSISMVWGYSHC